MFRLPRNQQSLKKLDSFPTQGGCPLVEKVMYGSCGVLLELYARLYIGVVFVLC